MSPIKRPRFGGVFLFCPFEIQPRTSVCSAFCVVHAKFTTSDAKSFTGLCRSFSGYLPHFAPVIRLRILQGAGGHTSKRSASTDTRYHRCAWTQHRTEQPPIIIIYTGGVCRCVPVMDPCQAVQHIADHASGGGSASPPVQGQPGGVSILPTPGGLQSGTGQQTGQSSGGGVAGDAEPLAATAATLFGLSPDS